MPSEGIEENDRTATASTRQTGELNTTADEGGFGGKAADSGTAPSVDRSRYSRPHQWLKNLKPYLKILGSLALIIYTVFAGLQWSQIRRTNQLTGESLKYTKHALEETIKQANSADVAANIAAAQLEFAERPQISIRAVVSGPMIIRNNKASLPLRISYHNDGRGVALIAKISNWLGYDTNILETHNRCLVDIDDSQISEELMPTKDLVSDIILDMNLSPSSAKSGGPGVTVCIAYRPSFERKIIYSTQQSYGLSRLVPGVPNRLYNPLSYPKLSNKKLALQLITGSAHYDRGISVERPHSSASIIIDVYSPATRKKSAKRPH